MDERIWRGQWWAADDPESKFPGTLHCNEEGRLRLELIGGLDVAIRRALPSGNGYSITDESRDVPLIHGVSGKEEFTLLDNDATHTSGTGFLDGVITRQDWASGRALRGVHLEDLDAPISVRGHLRLERLLHILFGLRYIERGYMGTRLLGVASAAESLHAALRSASTPIPKEQYKKLKRKLLAAIADESPESIEFVNTGLHNYPTYNSRMMELASIPDSDTVDWLLSNRANWARMLKGARNDLAHAMSFHHKAMRPLAPSAYWRSHTPCSALPYWQNSA